MRACVCVCALYLLSNVDANWPQPFSSSHCVTFSWFHESTVASPKSIRMSFFVGGSTMYCESKKTKENVKKKRKDYISTKKTTNESSCWYGFVRVDTIETRRSLNGCLVAVVVGVAIVVAWKKKEEERKRFCGVIRVRERKKGIKGCDLGSRREHFYYSECNTFFFLCNINPFQV